ncbi:MAG: hypothetical protein KAJ49_11015, partial [Arcobacteraceae bacterium]|nr:hypothetical protein [Arcobacteraceae bacterium]
MISEHLKKQIEDAQKSLENFKKMNPSFDYNQTMKSATMIDSSILEYARTSNEEAQKYANQYSEIIKDLPKTHNLSTSTQELLSLGKEMNEEIYKYKIDDLNSREKELHDIEYSKPMEFRNYASEMLEEFKIQNERSKI